MAHLHADSSLQQKWRIRSHCPVKLLSIQCFVLICVWKGFQKRARWQQGYTLGLKRCSNYCLRYAFVVLCLDSQHHACHAVAGEAACFSFHVVRFLLEANAAQSVKTVTRMGHTVKT